MHKTCDDNSSLESQDVRKNIEISAELKELMEGKYDGWIKMENAKGEKGVSEVSLMFF